MQTLPQVPEKGSLCLKGNLSLQPSDCSRNKPLAGETSILSEGVNIKKRLFTRWSFSELYSKTHNKAQDQHILIVLFIPFFHINFFPTQACPSLLEINCTQTSARYFCGFFFLWLRHPHEFFFKIKQTGIIQREVKKSSERTLIACSSNKASPVQHIKAISRSTSHFSPLSTSKCVSLRSQRKKWLLKGKCK